MNLLLVWEVLSVMTVSLECLMQCEDVSFAFSLEASKVSGRWHVLRNMTNKWVVFFFCVYSH
jgi:hypothetical protein